MKEVIDWIKKFQHKDIDPYCVNYALATQTLIGGGSIHIVKEIVSNFLEEKDYYLEVGCFQAWNFSLACHFAKCKCLAVDNFSQDFQECERYKLPTRDLVIQNIETIGRGNGELIEGDFRETLAFNLGDIKEKVKFYFYDGPHEEKDQIDGVELALPLLADEAIIMVDDWASENVKTSTRYLLNKHKELSLIKVLDGPHNRQYFNQGQVVFSYSRNA